MNLVMRRLPVLPIIDGRWISGGNSGLRWWLSGVGLALLLTVVVMVSRYAADPMRFPVAQVDVVGTLDYTDRDALRERIASHLDNSFYTLDIDAIQAALVELPWVQDTHVSRLWPDRLMIDVTEHQPVARWNNRALVSRSLTVFEPDLLRPEHERHQEWLAQLRPLPRLFGAEGRHGALLAAWHDYNDRLAPTGLELERLSEDPRLSQTLTLSGSVTVRLGYAEQLDRLQRFIDVYARLQENLQDQPSRFDMRYPNGFALAGASTAQEGS